MENNNFNMLEMVAELSAKLGAENPNLKDLLGKGLNGSLGSSTDIKDFLINAFPDKEEEINKNLNMSDMQNKIDKIKEGLNNLDAFKSMV
jgi:hypothetical protein